MKKYIGYLLYSLIGRHLPVSYSNLKIGQKAFRGFCAKLMLKECGKNVNIEKNAKFSTKISIGDNSGIGERCSVANCTIGKNVMMGRECIILSRNHNFSSTEIPMIEQGFQEEKPPVIGDDVWIGHRVIILPGARIGNGCVIGAGAVVSGNIPDYSIAAGVPAKVIRSRK
ncbi:MAG: acyltransferase [Acutalibacteraceae bacterium]|nr:acyltransferase [Acutalibacteraceae bacterium]